MNKTMQDIDGKYLGNVFDLSIIITVRDRWEEAGDCLQILARQAEISRCEVIVVDDGSLTQAQQRLSSLSSLCKLSIIRHAIPLGIAAARNSGMRSAIGKIILFIDSDCQPDSAFLKNLLQMLQQYPTDIAFQANLCGGTNSIAQRIESFRLSAIQKFRQTSNGYINYLNTSGFVIRAGGNINNKDLFNPGVSRGEDSLLLAELSTREQLPRFMTHARIRHCPRLSLGRYLLKHFWIGYDNGYAHECLRTRLILLSLSERRAAFSWMWHKARHEQQGVLVFTVAMLAYALEISGRIAYRFVGMRPSRQTVLSTIIDPVNTNELLTRILAAAQKKEGLAVTYLTAWSLVLTKKDPSFRQLLNNFDICYADSIGVVYTSLLTQLRRLKKVTANAFFQDLCLEAANRGLSIALIGSQEAIVRQVAAQLCAKIQNLKIPLCAPGYLTQGEEGVLIKRLQDAAPDIVVVGRGQPLQEQWVMACRSRMPRTVFLCVGGLFDYLSGNIRQTPGWMRRLGLEWTHRLFHQPKRYGWIYLYGIPLLGVYIFSHYCQKLWAMAKYLKFPLKGLRGRSTR